MRYIILFASLFVVVSSFGQGYNRKKKDAFPQPPRFEKIGWYFGPGVTFPVSVLHTREAEGTKIGDTVFTTNSSPGGNLGFFGEFGRYHLITNLYFFKYWNYGINYRWIKGQEGFENQLVTPAASTALGAGQNTFSDHFANAHIEISGANKLSDKTFLQHTLGGQVGYGVATKRSYTTNLPGLTETTQGAFHSYLYYRIGWGVRASKKLMVIPTVEFPILNIQNFNSGRFDMPYFNSQYWPITVSLRFFLSRPYRMKICPPVDAIGLPEGYDADEPNK